MIGRIITTLLIFSSFHLTHAQPVDIELEGGAEVITEGESKFEIKFVIVDSEAESVLVVYDFTSKEGEERRNLRAKIFLNNDRLINYKMAMLTLLRDAIQNDKLDVFISILPGTENTTNRTIRAVSIRPRA